MLSGIQEVRARGARTICLAEEGDERIVPYADVLIRLPSVPVLLQPLVAVVPLQLFACELATRAGPRRRPAAQPGQVRHGRVAAADTAIIGVGIDVVDIERFGASLDRTPGLRERLFTPGRGGPDRWRRSPPASPPRRRSPRRSAPPADMHWHDAEVVSEESGRPVLRAARHRAGPRRRPRRRLACTSRSRTTPASRRPWWCWRAEASGAPGVEAPSDAFDSATSPHADRWSGRLDGTSTAASDLSRRRRLTMDSGEPLLVGLRSARVTANDVTPATGAARSTVGAASCEAETVVD